MYGLPPQKKKTIWDKLIKGKKKIVLLISILTLLLGVITNVNSIKKETKRFFGKNNGELVITDILYTSLGRGKYELDIRLENRGTDIISLSKIILESEGILGCMSGILTSHTSEIPLDISNLKIGETIEENIAISIKPNEVDRIKIILSSNWTKGCKTHNFNCKIKTNNGIVKFKKQVNVPLLYWSSMELKLTKAVFNNNIHIIKSILKDDKKYINVVYGNLLVRHICSNGNDKTLNYFLRVFYPKNSDLFEDGLYYAKENNQKKIITILTNKGIKSEVKNTLFLKYK